MPIFRTVGNRFEQQGVEKGAALCGGLAGRCDNGNGSYRYQSAPFMHTMPATNPDGTALFPSYAAPFCLGRGVF